MEKQMTRTQSPVAWLRSEALEGTQRLCKRNVSEGELNSELHSELHSELQAKCKQMQANASVYCSPHGVPMTLLNS